MARLTVLPDAAAMADAASGRLTALIEAVTIAHGTAAVALAGGYTPEPVYQRLADPEHPWRARIDWPRVHLYWSDERNVPPDHPDSNFGLAHRTLIQHVPIPAAHAHRIRGELSASDAGREYDATLRTRRSQAARALFDVMLLGIGPDAHIASIFPESPLLASPQDSFAAGVWVPTLGQWRITLTPPALLDSTAIIVLAAGPAKADAIAAAIEGDPDVARYPAQWLREAGDRVEWIVDAAAAGLVSL